MLLLASQFGGYFTYTYKTIGLSVQMSDHVLSMASSASGFVQLVSRIFFGTLYDKVGYKKIFYVIMAINALNGFLVYNFRYNQIAYLICVELMYMVFGGIYSILPVATTQTFGQK
jgi:Na+/melibiose symporter-like transporter